MRRHRSLRSFDSLDMQSTIASDPNAHHRSSQSMWVGVMQLAFQSIGVVYGDIGTSPLYLYASTFTGGINHNDDVLGVLSMVIYTITLIPLVKYVFIVFQANEDGEGGTFALYSLICRYAKVELVPKVQSEDEYVFQSRLASWHTSTRSRRASNIKSELENSHFAKLFLLLTTMLGTCMVIGDGVLTPCISVLSAVGGIKQAAKSVTDDGVVWISVAILVCLFMVQRFGTDKVGYSFAPIMCVWFTFIGGTGIYNFIKYDPTVLKALNPAYIIQYFQRNKRDAWISLGGVVLSITGTEALFAGVGHFSVRSIQISMCSVVYPAIILAYSGQASFLRKHNNLVGNTFYESIPGPLYWPMLVIAVAAAIIASQAIISGTFSIIKQSLSMACFPPVKIVHTSAKYEGQVYIPKVNYFLMIACVAVTLGFRDATKIANAYGVAVVFAMTLTSALLVLIMIMLWKTHLLLVIGYVVIFYSVEMVYLCSVLYKLNQGGYIPLAFAAVFMPIMVIWNNVNRWKKSFELNHKISPKKLKEVAAETQVSRIPGMALFYSELIPGIPPIFQHYVTNVPALHSVLVFVSIKSLYVSEVTKEGRFLFRSVEPRELNVFRCVARYGFAEVRHEQEQFERLLVDELKVYISRGIWVPQRLVIESSETDSDGERSEVEDEGEIQECGWEDEMKQQEDVDRETEAVERAVRAGVVHLIGESEVVASRGSNIWKKILINHAYNFLKKNSRQSDQGFDIPHKRLLKVGMTYEL